MTAIGVCSAALGSLSTCALAYNFDRPTVIFTGGLAAFAVATVTLATVVKMPGPVPPSRRRASAVIVGVGTLLLIVTVLAPTSVSQHPAVDVEGMRTVTLPTGSQLAYSARHGEVASARPPILFLHGGPGTPDMKGDINYFGRLARDGHDVYVYDQVGSGHSERLDDPRNYTVERHSADLEAFRRYIGAESMILVAHSAGAEIASTYMSKHASRVDRLVVISPAAVPGFEDRSGRRYLDSLSARSKLSVLQHIAWPRIMTAYGLLQVNPVAAHNLVGDGEMDARFDRVYNSSRQVLHCADRDPGPELHNLGFYANQYPQSATASRPRDVRSALIGNMTPTLILKGECDYLSWSSVSGYLTLMQNSQLVYVRHAGHNLYQDQPDTVLEMLRAFLADQPLPITPRINTTPPESYHGPP